jgi:predicted ATPase
VGRSALALLLDFLARRLPAGAAPVVGADRDVDPVPGPGLAAVAARCTVLPLTGLTVEAVTALIEGVVGEQQAREVVAEVHRRTGGNPFFAQQVSWLLKGGRSGVPPGAAQALAQRLASLPEASTAAVAAAAVAGPRFSAGLVARAVGLPPEAVAGSLAEAVRARVLNLDGPDRYRFTHDLFREYAYHELPAADQARLHQRIGVELEAERDSGGDVSLAELARHFVQADPGSARARRYCVAAASEATRRLAYEEAVHHWEGAWPCCSPRVAARSRPPTWSRRRAPARTGGLTCGWERTRCSTRPRAARSRPAWPIWPARSRKRRAGTIRRARLGPARSGTCCCASSR